MRWLTARVWTITGVALAIAILTLAAPGFVLGGAPVLLLALALVAGRFPGEHSIARLCERRSPRRLADAPLAVRADPRSAPRRSRLLICFSLANRPPPLPLHA